MCGIIGTAIQNERCHFVLFCQQRAGSAAYILRKRKSLGFTVRSFHSLLVMALVVMLQDLLAEDAWMMAYLSGQRLDCLWPMFAQQRRARAWSPHTPHAAFSGIESACSSQDLLQATNISSVRERLFKYEFPVQPPAGTLTGMDCFQLGDSDACVRSRLRVPEAIAACLQAELKAYGWPSPGQNVLAILAQLLHQTSNVQLTFKDLVATVADPMPAGKQVYETASSGLPIPVESLAATLIQLKGRLEPEFGCQQLLRQAKDTRQAGTGNSSPEDASAAHVDQKSHVAPDSVNKNGGMGSPDQSVPAHLSSSTTSSAADSSASCQPLSSVRPVALASPGLKAQQHPRQALKASSAASGLKRGWLLPSSSAPPTRAAGPSSAPALSNTAKCSAAASSLKRGWLQPSSSAPRNDAATPASAPASSTAAECSAAARSSLSGAASDAIPSSSAVTKRVPPTAESLGASSGGASASAAPPCTESPAPMLEDVKTVMQKQEARQRTKQGTSTKQPSLNRRQIAGDVISTFLSKTLHVMQVAS